MNKFLEQTKKAANKARQASISNLNAASTALSNASGTNIKLTNAKTDEDLKRLLEEEPILFSGSVWKRRGGLGKLASYTSAWECRYLQLRGHVLLYFDSDPSKALSSSNDPQELLRGYIDLAEEKATVQASSGHSGAPSPFCLSIKVPVAHTQETKWKLCFDHHQTQMEWLAVISDVIVQTCVDSYNRALLEAANPSNHGGGGGVAGPIKDASSSLLRRPPVYEPGTKELNSGGGGSSNSSQKPRSSSFQLVDSPHQLWMMDDYTLERKTTQTKEQQAKTKASVDTALQVMERLLAEERNQRAISKEKVKALEIELGDARTVKDESLQELARMTTAKNSLETELAIRISTHDLGDAREQENPENLELRKQVETLTKELESHKAQALEQTNDNDEDSELYALEQKLAELQTKLVIAKSDHEETLNKVKEEAQQKQTEEVESVRKSMGGRIETLEKEMEASKKEYQESIQELASSFQMSVGAPAVEKENGEKATNGTSDEKKEGMVANAEADIPAIHRTQSDASEIDEFEDCVEK
jgi:hypothetical protein